VFEAARINRPSRKRRGGQICAFGDADEVIVAALRGNQLRFAWHYVSTLVGADCVRAAPAIRPAPHRSVIAVFGNPLLELVLANF
jgi:hypothetical protein